MVKYQRLIRPPTFKPLHTERQTGRKRSFPGKNKQKKKEKHSLRQRGRSTEILSLCICSEEPCRVHLTPRVYQHVSLFTTLDLLTPWQTVAFVKPWETNATDCLAAVHTCVYVKKSDYSGTGTIIQDCWDLQYAHVCQWEIISFECMIYTYIPASMNVWQYLESKYNNCW